jgi:hypothetical protein
VRFFLSWLFSAMGMGRSSVKKLAACVGTLLAVILFAGGASAQRTPDFSGRWIAISPGYSGREIRITRARGTLKVTNALDRGTESVTYNLDGTPRREPSGPAEERWSTAAWKGGTLLLTNTRLTRTSETRTEQTLSFDSTGRLILGTTKIQLDANRDSSAPPPVPQRKTVIVLKKR